MPSDAVYTGGRFHNAGSYSAERAGTLGRRIGMGHISYNLALIAALFFLNKLGAPGNLLFFTILIWMMLKSSEWALRAVSLMFLVIVGNTALVNTTIVFSLGKFAFLLMCSIRLYYSAQLRRISLLSHPVVLPLLMFVIVSMLLALEGGYRTDISALKLFTYTTGMMVVLAGAVVMRGRSHSLDNWFLSMALFVVLVGLLSYAAGIGFNAKTEEAIASGLFNGPFYHPQTLGPGAAMMTLYLLCYTSLTSLPYRKLALFLIPTLLFFIYLSSSRTSILAIAMAILVAVICLAFMQRSALKKMMRIIRLGAVFAVFGGIALLTIELVAPGTVVDRVVAFTVKNNRVGEVSADAVLSSRASLLEMMWGNIAEQPWTGIGFGTTTRAGFAEYATIFNATTEKGVLPIAVVEETGYIGAIFFTLLVVSLIAYCLRTRNIPGLIAFAGLLGLNMAEANFFSFGGHGGFFWIWVMAALILNDATETSAHTVRASDTPPERPARSAVQPVHNRKDAS